MARKFLLKITLSFKILTCEKKFKVKFTIIETEEKTYHNDFSGFNCDLNESRGVFRTLPNI